MKLEYQRQEPEDIQKQLLDLSTMLDEWKKEYRSVYQYQIDNIVFFYRTVNRDEWKKLNESELTDMQKEEVICSCCTLFPQNFDFEDCDAGIPTVLTKMILRNSFLDSMEHRQEITNFYRSEMRDLQNQITCIINEAFPQFDIEEIEKWDIEKTAKYLSRAEWKMVNLRGAQINYDPNQIRQDAEQQVQAHMKTDSPNTSKQGKEKMTPEKLAELKAKYPEMQWGEIVTTPDNIGPTMDVTSPALRTGY